MTDRTTSEQLSSIFWMLASIWVAILVQTCQEAMR